eukprot:comp21907_c0_seq1/m.31453 comp21907_c0_seq1/g.31453  ORF comp21907_c0_seq1/g.31453 comp21907_c0_seq1/m.31453 type:complete len:330 (-) comp21907_c0_seq1:527-1516(-)
MFRPHLLGHGARALRLLKPTTITTQTAARFLPCHLFRRHYSSKHETITWHETPAGESPRLILPVGGEAKRMFVVSPNDNVSHFIKSVETETGAEAKATVDDVEVAGSTDMSCLVGATFDLHIGSQRFTVNPSTCSQSKITHDLGISNVEYARDLLKQLYTVLDVERAAAEKASDLKTKVVELRRELEPMEDMVSAASKRAEKHTNRLIWGGLGLMGVQFGILFRMTYWEYSWDIVEPLTYFVTYANTIGAYWMFVITQKDLEYRTMAERKFIQTLHKQARKRGVDISRYNELKRELAEKELQLNKLLGSASPLDILVEKERANKWTLNE